MDQRHSNRIHIVQNLFSQSFEATGLPHPKDTVALEILKQKDTLDGYIAKHTDKFSIDKLAKIDLAILRLAVYELTVEKKNPPKVIINEAIELAKELGGDKSYSFINGILGKVYADIS